MKLLLPSLLVLATVGALAGPPQRLRVVKPELSDSIKANVYADNWFVLYINGKQVAVDPIDFLPHNVVSVDLLPEYPMTIAVMAMDNADPKTGCEYGDSIGDGGFILKFPDGTVTDASWKAKSIFTGPLDRDTKSPRVSRTPLPANWFAPSFDDSTWPAATVFSEEVVGPKKTFYDYDFVGAKFIWSQDLELDNTVIFRKKIEKPGWKPRWTTKPDLVIGGETVAKIEVLTGQTRPYFLRFAPSTGPIWMRIQELLKSGYKQYR